MDDTSDGEATAGAPPRLGAAADPRAAGPPPPSAPGFPDTAHGANPDLLRDLVALLRMQKADVQDEQFKHRDFDAAPAQRELWVVWAVCCFVERGWRFGFGIVLSQLEGGFHAIAVCGFLQHLAALALAPAAGRLLDRTSRVLSLAAILGAQNLLVALTACYILWGTTVDAAILRSNAFLAGLAGFQIMQRVANALSDVAIERDWVVVVAKRDEQLLAEGNATIRRIDQVSEIVSTLCFGAALTTFGLGPAVAGTLAVTAALTPVQLGAILRLRQICGAALRRPAVGAPERGAGSGDEGDGAGVAVRALLRVRAAAKGVARNVQNTWGLFFAQPTTLPSLALVVLFFNTAMSPTGILTAYLTSNGMNGTTAATFRGACAALGFVGIGVGTRLIARTSVPVTGAVALCTQLTCLGLAVVSFAYFTATQPGAAPAAGLAAGLVGAVPTAGPLAALGGWLGAVGEAFTGMPLPLLLFCFFIAISRVGLWMYDMVDAQMFQMMVKPQVAGTVSSVEAAMCSLTELTMMGVAVAIGDVENFGVLIRNSFGAVLLATCIYYGWMFSGGIKMYAQSQRRLADGLAPA